jgi:hypothetical protein
MSVYSIHKLRAWRRAAILRRADADIVRLPRCGSPVFALPTLHKRCIPSLHTSAPKGRRRLNSPHKPLKALKTAFPLWFGRSFAGMLWRAVRYVNVHAHCSFAYSALACFRMDVGVGVSPEREEILVRGPCFPPCRLAAHMLVPTEGVFMVVAIVLQVPLFLQSSID